MNYGVPYMGSKSKICKDVCAIFPKSDHFYDLFGGGFSITHFMIKHRRGHYKHFHFNELRSGMTELLQDAISGKYNYNVYKPEWISRERFMQDKEKDLLIKLIWSFGNNGRDYLFGKDIEQSKKSMHMAIVFNEFDDYAKKIFGVDRFVDGLSIIDKRLYLKNRIKTIGANRLDLEQLERLAQLEQLQHLEQLERLAQLERLEQLQRLNFYNSSYEEVKIEKNSVIYCDIPYGGTTEYDKSSSSFDRKKFLNWANEQENPVYISEYKIEDDRFKCIANFQKRSMLNKDKSTTLIKTEKVYVNKAGYLKMFTRNSNV